MASSIINSDNGLSSGTSGLKTTGGNDGITAFQQNGTESMRIDSSGNVGIGTAAGGNRLRVTSADNTGTTNIALFESNNGNQNVVIRFAQVMGQNGDFTTGTITNHNYLFSTNNTERMRIDSNGNVGIGMTPDGSSLLQITAGTASLAPIELTAGSLMTVPDAGSVEYDGTTMAFVPHASYGRATVPLVNYASGSGTALTTNGETTLQLLLPAANDRITLPIGTYFLDTAFIITRGPTSTTAATARLNILGAGTAAGNFSGMSISAPTSGGASANFSFDAVNINVSNVLTASSSTAAGVYQISLRGILKITTAGVIAPQYNLSANINAAGTVSKVWYFRLQQLDTQSAAAFGPAGTGWA